MSMDPYGTSDACPYGHAWLGGMVYVDPEDVETVATERQRKGLRPVECERCETRYVATR